jgi:chorismate mutase
VHHAVIQSTEKDLLLLASQRREAPPQVVNGMDLTNWRLKIDELDRQIVELISERARAAQQIGRLKKDTSLPVYEPARESVIFANVRAANHGPLPDIELTHIYERIIDVMRALQQEELASARRASDTSSSAADSHADDRELGK